MRFAASSVECGSSSHLSNSLSLCGICLLVIFKSPHSQGKENSERLTHSECNTVFQLMSTEIDRLLKKYFTLGEAARTLKISRITLWRKIRDGELAASRVGREVLIKKGDLQSWQRSFQ